MPGTAVFVSCVLSIAAAPIGPAPLQKREGGRHEQTEQIHQREGEALIALADAAMAGQQVPSDLSIQWQNHFLKAQDGTFVPFVVTIDAASLTTPSVLLYVRLLARGTTRPRSTREGRPSDLPSFAAEEVFPIDLRSAIGRTARVARGFSARAGEYDLIVVVREREDADRPGLSRRTGVLNLTLVVPDFPAGELATSSLILAERLTVLDALPAEMAQSERPYLMGLNDIQPAADNVFRRDEELIVVFLVYNPFVTSEKKFDVEVEYHFFTTAGADSGRGRLPAAGVSAPPARDGERYFNHTKPQRFTPAIMGPQFDPAAGQPLMAGQGVPLAAFPEGEYRLTIKVTDVVTGTSILRDVTFTVVS